MCDWPRGTYRPWKNDQYKEGADLFLCYHAKLDKWLPADLGDIHRRGNGPKKSLKDTKGHKPVLTAYKQGLARREAFVEHVKEHQSIQEALQHVGVHNSSYTRWRQKYPDFAARVDLARGIRVTDRIDYTGDFATFRRNYFGMSTTWFQLHAVKALEECKEGEIILMLWHPESGKGLAVQERVPTLRGWMKAGDIRVGDQLFGRDGQPTRVVGVYPQGVKRLRRVWFVDGTHLDVDVDHNWLVRDRRRQMQKGPAKFLEHVLTTADLEGNELMAGGRHAFGVPVCDPLQMPAARLPIEPWVLGYWLGNGDRDSGRITTHRDDLDWVVAEYRAAGYRSAPRRDKRNGSGYFTPYGLHQELRALGVLNNKHVPEMYLWASEEQRRALLAGLLDADGHSGGVRSQSSVSFVDKELTDAAEFLLRSLGLKPTCHKNMGRYRLPNGDVRFTRLQYGMRWTDPDGCFTSPRKRAMRRTSSGQGDRLRWRYIDRIENIGEGESVCFRVDAADHLFVAGEQMVVSHNTTTVCDFINMKLALDPTCRITVVSENRNHAMKMLRRVRNRMEPDGPCPLYVRTFGPFVPDEATGSRGATQPWAADHFDVRQRGDFDEQDFSCSAAGITTAIQGTRADWLILDDVQSLKSLNLTDTYLDRIRQDFLSRSGMFGRVCILGTRVGNDDVYRRLIDEELVDTLIKFPAQDHDGRWLWPERYSEDQYLKIRKRVGEQAWWRNYMQEPASAKDSAFNAEIVEPCFNPTRSIIADAPQELDVHGHPTVMPVVIGVDPALGSTNSITAVGLGAKKLYYLGSRADTGFTRNEEIFDVIEQTVIRWNLPGVSQVVEVVIEAMNFQQGLVDDDRMRELVKRYGFRVVPSLVGHNKYDPNIGVSAMPLSFMRKEIDLPYSDKPSQDEIRLFVAELYAWRPYKRGNRLRQDRVMSFWSAWQRWRGKRAVVAVDPRQFASKASPLRRPA